MGNRDPKLDLPQEQWWMASAMGKSSTYSSSLLTGLGNALCILAVYGSDICGNRLGTDIGYRVGEVVRSLMRNANEEQWLSIRSHMRVFAESSPLVFLECIEENLQGPDPSIKSIMGVAGSPISGECLRSNLLWALEGLAWSPAYFARVVEITFKLRKLEAKDQWANTAAATSRALFLAWLPATTVSVAERMKVLRHLASRYRTAVIDVCITLLPSSGPEFATKTAQPLWRDSVNGDLLIPTNDDVLEAARKTSELLLDMAPFDKVELTTLVGVLAGLSENDLDRFVSEVKRWSYSASDADKAELLNDLRQQTIAIGLSEDEAYLNDTIAVIEKELEPDCLLARYRWLFDSYSVEWRSLAKQESRGDLTWQKRGELIMTKRVQATQDIEYNLGKAAALDFALSVKCPELVAETLVTSEASAETAAEWIDAVLLRPVSKASNRFLRQLVFNAGGIDLGAVIIALGGPKKLLRDKSKLQRLVAHLPGNRDGWEAAEALGMGASAAYWGSVSLRLWSDSATEDFAYAANRLLEYHRPRTAFSALASYPDRLPPNLWISILEAIIAGKEADAPWPDAYLLSEVLVYLDGSEDIPDDIIARLELPFIPLLCPHGQRRHARVLAVHRELTSDPMLFVQLLKWRYPRADGAPEQDTENRSPKYLADLARHTLRGWKQIPGYSENGDVDSATFLEWFDVALVNAARVDRKFVAEHHLGHHLASFARSRHWDDWLPDCILEFLDRPEHDKLRDEFAIGIRNSRGVTTRGPYDGGFQERKLAEHYFKLSNELALSYPRVSALLVSVAEYYLEDGQRHDDTAAISERWRS